MSTPPSYGCDKSLNCENRVQGKQSGVKKVKKFNTFLKKEQDGAQKDSWKIEIQ